MGHVAKFYMPTSIVPSILVVWLIMMHASTNAQLNLIMVWIKTGVCSLVSFHLGLHGLVLTGLKSLLGWFGLD